jgi:hypothetical protein
VRAEPGQRIEQLARAMGTATKEMALPVRKLIGDGVLRTEGARRATKYFPSDGRSGGTPKKRRGRKARG